MTTFTITGTATGTVPAGPTGPAGPAGPQGIQGIPGPTGPAGSSASDNIFNVKRDFGAKGDGTTDDYLALQAALDAASKNWGGTVYFPRGVYITSKRLEVGTPGHSLNPPGWSGGAITIIGDGADCADSGGSIIQGTFHDYLLYISQSGHPVKSIKNMGFKNYGQYTFTSAEPQGNPDQFAGFAGGDGGGCVYAGSGISFTISDCDFQTSSGICVHNGAFGMSIIGTNFSGSFDNSKPGNWAPGSPTASIGISSRGHLKLEASKPYGFGIAVAIYNSASLVVEGLDLEVCGVGLLLGANPVGFWDSNLHAYNAQWSGYGGGSVDCSIRNVGMESCSAAFMFIAACSNLTVEEFNWASFQYTPNAAIIIGGLRNALFSNGQLSGTFTKDVVDICSGVNSGGPIFWTNYQNIGNIRFENVNASGNVPAWSMPPVSVYQPGDLPVTFKGCTTDGAIPLSQLPVAPNVPLFPTIDPVVVNDSVDPTWDSTNAKSNVGKPITGGGTNKVRSVWNGTQWVIGG